MIFLTQKKKITKKKKDHQNYEAMGSIKPGSIFIKKKKKPP